MPPMIRLRNGVVLAVLEERPGAAALVVEVNAAEVRAIAYPDLVGPVAPGDHVVLNTTAVALGLGTGGWDFVVAVYRPDHPEADLTGRVMKLRYTPHQVNVQVAEEGGPGQPAAGGSVSLRGAPVVWVPLHSMIAPVAAGARAAGAGSVAYVMTDGAALPAPFSRLADRLRRAGLVDAVVTAGQAFGGDVESVTVFSALLAGRARAGADVLIVGDGPGNTGTGTTWGSTAVQSAMSMNAAAILGGRPVAALRISFADPRKRHRTVSHHSLTALGRVAILPVHVAVPVIEDPAQREAVWDALRSAHLEERHQLVEVTGRPALDLLAAEGIEVESMGRTVWDDPVFFLAAGAAGVLAGRMAVQDEAWRP
jgi:hypothetical protein